MKIASWNVNSIKQRQGHVEKWLQDNDPDVLILQELKGQDYPYEVFEKIGYKSAVVNQKGRNGVAALYKQDYAAEIISDKLHGYEDDEQARYMEIDLAGIKIIGIYAPNGNPVGTEKYDYKMKWMEHLFDYCKGLREQGTDFLVTGDFNIIPQGNDCHSVSAWAEDALYLLSTRNHWRALCNLGLTDAFRVRNSKDEQYTFWDYQAGAWQKNNGIRIDHFLLSPALTDRLEACTIDPQTRGWEKPSDHVPIYVELSK